MDEANQEISSQATAIMPEQETAEELQLIINEAQKKLNAANEKEDEEQSEKITLPLATVHLRIEKNVAFDKANITPPELMLLCAMHHANAKGNPAEVITPTPETKDEIVEVMRPNPLKNGALEKVSEIQSKPTGKVKTVTMEPRAMKLFLVGRYGAEKVEKLFPGATPKFPTKFRQAMMDGIGTALPNSRLFDMDIAKVS